MKRVWKEVAMKSHAKFLLTAAILGAVAHAQTLQGDSLVKALRQGGYIIVMRHASSPREVPTKQAANPDNTTPERQLDAEGRASATAFGKALKDLKIPIGTVLASPTYRALETVKYAQLGTPQPRPELGENGQNMSGGTEAQAAWLQKQVTQFPSGSNTILITHLPNLTRAFPQLAMGMADGEALIFAPDGKGGNTVVARVKIEDWPKLK
jgi:phosphohistidine phosphatase SixA